MIGIQKKQTEEKFWFLRRPAQFLADVAVLCGAFFLAYLLRFEFSLDKYYLDNALNQLPFVVLVQFSSLFLVGAYSIIWRYVSLEDIKAFLKAALISGIVLGFIQAFSITRTFYSLASPVFDHFLRYGTCFCWFARTARSAPVCL